MSIRSAIIPYYMLQRLERFMHRHDNTSFGPLTVQVTAKERVVLSGYYDTKCNLLEARKQGIKPLSYDEVAAQISSADLKNTILFDETLSSPGNHWRIVGVNQEGHFVILQHCNHFGYNDDIQIPPMQVSTKVPFFTGISIPHFTYDGKPVPLSQITQLFSKAQTERERLLLIERLERRPEQIFFADANGTLLPCIEHPGWTPVG